MFKIKLLSSVQRICISLCQCKRTLPHNTLQRCLPLLAVTHNQNEWQITQQEFCLQISEISECILTPLICITLSPDLFLVTNRPEHPDLTDCWALLLTSLFINLHKIIWQWKLLEFSPYYLLHAGLQWIDGEYLICGEKGLTLYSFMHWNVSSSVPMECKALYRLICYAGHTQQDQLKARCGGVKTIR